MRPNPQFPEDLVLFTKEIFNGKLYFLCSGPLNCTSSVTVNPLGPGDHWQGYTYLNKPAAEKMKVCLSMCDLFVDSRF